MLPKFRGALAPVAPSPYSYASGKGEEGKGGGGRGGCNHSKLKTKLIFHHTIEHKKIMKSHLK